MEEGGHPDVRLGGLTGREGRRTAAHTVRRSPALETGAGMEDEKHGDFAEGEEKEPDKPHHEGSFAEGEGEGHDHGE